MNKKHFYCVFSITAVLFLLSALFSFMFGSIFISPAEIVKIIFSGVRDGRAHIFLYSRLPRTAAALLAGAALSVSGAVLQKILFNKLASPGIIGVNAGAGAGVTIACALGLLSGIETSLFAFAGSLFAVGIISVFASRTNASRSTVILGGVALNSVMGAISEAIAVLNPSAAALTAEFRVGGFSAVSLKRLIPAGLMIIFAVLVLMSLTNELDVTALGDETALSVGLSVKKYRIIFLVLAALSAGAAVSFSGLLGFVGLIVPHFIRKLTGSESRKLLPVCALGGAAFVCLCDTLSRLLFQPYELPVGIFMALIGGPVFVIMLIKMKGGHSSAAD